MYFRYTLEPYRGRTTRFACPRCGKAKDFTRYIDRETGEYVGETVGICNRRAKCGYHLAPREYFQNNPDLGKRPEHQRVARMSASRIDREFDTIPQRMLDESRKRSTESNFYRFLDDSFGSSAAIEASDRYSLGTSTDGRVIFWQIDHKHRIRTGKIMQYDPSTGERMKSRHPAWAHNLIRVRGRRYRLSQCLFGESLATEAGNKRIAIVEAEKTAVIASIFFPNLIWLATGGCSNLKPERLDRLVPLKTSITLFPDSTQFKKWSSLVAHARTIHTITVSRLIEQSLSDELKAKDLDLADLILALRGSKR